MRNLDTQSAQVSVHERCMEGDDVVELTAEGKARRGTTWQRPQLRDSVFWQAADSSELRKNATRWRVVCRGCVLHKKIAGALAVSKDVSAGEGTLPVAFTLRLHQLQRKQPHPHSNQPRHQRGRLVALFLGKVTQMKLWNVIPFVP